MKEWKEFKIGDRVRFTPSDDDEHEQPGQEGEIVRFEEGVSFVEDVTVYVKNKIGTYAGDAETLEKLNES